MRMLVKGDGGTTVLATILGADGTPLDLSSKTATLAFSIADGTVQLRSMTILPQTTNLGQCSYTFETADLVNAGELEGEVRLNAGLPDVLTSEKFRIKVREPVTAGV